MNFRTTLLLVVGSVCLALAYMLARSGPETSYPGTALGPVTGGSTVARDLLEKTPGDLVKIVCRRKDQEEWVFEKRPESEGAEPTVWYMIAPREMKVVPWEVDRIGRQLTGVQYEVSYRPDEPGSPTAVEAGLDPPAAVVSLFDAEDVSVTLEIGKPASSSTTYVRLAGSEEIYAGKASLGNLIKPKALDYRDKQLWSFDEDDVTRVEIVDRSDPTQTVEYDFRREGRSWMMASPVTAKATSKVDDLLGSIRSLRVMNWHDDDPDRLGAYGLDVAALTVRVNVEEEVEAEQAETPEEGPETDEPAESDEEAAEPEPEIKVTVYELHVSSLSPIGEDTKAYVRIGDEPAVATITKTVADKFRPVMSEWREMRLTSANVTAARRIEVSTPDGAATLVRRDGQWSFEPDGGAAEESVVEELLDAVAGLTAVAFVDGEVEDPAAFGLDQPWADVRLTIPGVEDVERITVGGYTNPQAKRLVYVRRNEVASVAKVRAADVETLRRDARLYRDRTVIDVPLDLVEELTLSIDNRFADGNREVTFTAGEDTWRMSSPVEVSLRENHIEKLVQTISGLRAESVVAEAARGDLSAYGLDMPAAMIGLKYKPIGPPPADAEPPLESLELMVTEHENEIYAKRADRAAVCRLTQEFYEQLFAEFRTTRILEFDEAAVRQLTIRKGNEIHVFDRADEQWTYQPEPDLPLDLKKVDNLLLQVKDLRTEQYVDDTTPELSDYGLAEPFHELRVTLENGSSKVLWVSDQACRAGSGAGFYATVEDRPGVFLLSPDTLARVVVSLDEFEAER